METPYRVTNFNDIEAALADLIGKLVCVSWVSDHELLRNNFEPQVSVQAKLEGSIETGKFRALIDDNTYAYLYTDTVWSIVQDTDKRAVIFIEMKAVALLKQMIQTELELNRK
mgnify:CR=1 FL=1